MRSMTGFGKAEYMKHGLELKVTIKSLNNKSFSPIYKLPSQLDFYEVLIDNIIKKEIYRGKIIVAVTLNDCREENKQLEIDEDILDKFYNFCLRLRDRYNIKDEITISDLLRYKNIYRVKEVNYDTDEIKEFLTDVVNKALANLIKMKETEGEHIEENFIKILGKIEISLASIETSVPPFIQEIQSNLRNKIKSLLGSNFEEMDEKKLLNEIAYLVEKADITEEITRIHSHLKKFREKMESGEKDIGNSLNFIVQEMHREINTISAKCKNINIFNDILKIKEEVDKLKEQVRNVE